MGRLFSYCRVSTAEQDTENQMIAIASAGYDVEPHRVISETVSGGVQASKRPEFSKLLEKLEAGDTLVVLKLDRLGRDNIDVQHTIKALTEKSIKLISLDLPVSDLSSSEGRLMLQLFSAFAEFEKSRIRERTMEGLERAKAQGKKLGRPTSTESRDRVQALKADGLSQTKAAKLLGMSIRTVSRHWNTTD